MFLTIYADPARSIALPLLLIVWEYFQSKDREIISYKNIAGKISILLGVIILGLLPTSYGRSILFTADGNLQKLIQALGNKSYTSNYLTSLGNLFGSFITHDVDFEGVIAKIFKSPEIVGVFLIIILFLLSAISVVKRWKNYAFFIISFLGVLLFLLPNWIAFPYMAVSASHRYQTLSSMFFLFIVFNLLIKTPKKILISLTITLIVINIFRSYQINRLEKAYRDYFTVKAIYDKQELEAPQDLSDSLFFFGGKPPLSMLWAAGGTIPLSISRNISDINKLPAFTADIDLAANLVCSNDIKKQVIYDWFPMDKPIPIENVYAWRVNDSGRLENNTDEVRIKIAQMSECLKKDVNIKIFEDIKLNSIIRLNKLYTKDTQAVSFKWETPSDKDSKINIEYFIYDSKTSNLLKKEVVLTSTNDLKKSEGITNIFLKPIFQDDISVIINFYLCEGLCKNPKVKVLTVEL